MAGSAVALPSAPNPNPNPGSNPASSYTYDIKDFTERKTNAGDITLVTFNIVGTGGSTVNAHCVPWDVTRKKPVDDWQDKVLYACGENLPFYFTYTEETEELFLLQGAAPIDHLSGETTIATPYCHTAGAGSDQVCTSPAPASITVKKQPEQ
ncbi:hypothetical protein TI39_contig285g00031 [Zymoseptoria brevis]|uniref:AA1-like domain-containing protein n=1 Tax=Zymoseptoria brevis TaxID=1047168 RepID=A0A0F4GX59_9PEZI|nr:hypothetical protein TI39_contig285g00031 [Zymoseptoria brevis]